MWLVAEEERLTGMPLDDAELPSAQEHWQRQLRVYERLVERLGESDSLLEV
jgi:hypothetical protein